MEKACKCTCIASTCIARLLSTVEHLNLKFDEYQKLASFPGSLSLNHTASDGKLDEALGTRLPKNYSLHFLIR